ncbi:hypothetical protein K7X08_025112 [Anisodus acutangulus]|uniref:Uncharacterized protein n=1 Tax=Anisodus acutangulus TaxID=402998 RepID=A0A9Q1M972_9SOLA|nr:hypothetical protein K7X08_025112 [Anisodus acutangulus]
MGNYISVIVREFYATYGVILNSKRGRRHAKASMEPLGFVIIRGILGVVDQPDPTDVSVPTSTSVLEVLAPTTKTAPATSLATSSSPVVGPGIPAYGMRLIRLVEAKVTKLVDEFPAYVKEAIETALAPHKKNLEAVRDEQKSIRTQLQAIEL